MECSFELGLRVLDSYVSYILFSRNARRLMPLADLPRSPHSGACADLGLFCSHAAYCNFYMFESRWAVGWRWEGVGTTLKFSNQTNPPL